MTAALPSPFCVEHLATAVGAAGARPVLDVACGRGRHALAAARAGARVVGLDRSVEALGELRSRAALAGLTVACARSDLETGWGLPVEPASCGAVFVFRYLFRPLAPSLAAALAPGGILLFETFTQDQGKLPYGPNNPDFLLSPGELPRLFPELDILAHWEGRTAGDRPEALARLIARRPR